MTTTTAKLTDYSSSDYIPLVDGNVVIWKNFEYLRHSSNLSMYSEIAEETKALMNHFPQSHMKKILESDIGHIKTLLDTVKTHHRHARSINILGTALKVIAGTPDFDDFDKLKYKQQSLIESIDNQVVINTRVQEKINKLTDTVNIIINNEKTKQIDTDHLYETLLARDRILILELEALILSVTLAKIEIVNPTILDSKDLENILNEHSTDITITDLMEVAYINVFLDDNFLHFIVKFPSPSLVCKKVTLFPVEHNGTIINFAGYNNVADCENHTLAIGNCSTTLTSTFCRELSFTTCAQQLHAGTTAHCTTRPSHLEQVESVDDGVIIINNEMATVTMSSGTEKTIHGTFLLTFEDEVKINGSLFRNSRATVRRQPGSATAALLNITGHHEVLSLPYLQRLNIQNLRYIGDIEKQLVTKPAIFSVTMLLVAIIGLSIWKMYQKHVRARKSASLQTAIDNLRKSGDGLHLSEGGVNI
jgi:hypothetical protein